MFTQCAIIISCFIIYIFVQLFVIYVSFENKHRNICGGGILINETFFNISKNANDSRILYNVTK